MVLTPQPEMKKSGIEKSDVEDGEMEGGEVEASDGKNETEESDHFENCN